MTPNQIQQQLIRALEGASSHWITSVAVSGAIDDDETVERYNKEIDALELDRRETRYTIAFVPWNGYGLVIEHKPVPYGNNHTVSVVDRMNIDATSKLWSSSDDPDTFLQIVCFGRKVFEAPPAPAVVEEVQP